jgi:hypothetical protein
MSRPRRIFYATYGSILLLLNTLFFLSMPLLGQLMWISDRNTIGGPLGYYSTAYNNGIYVIVGNIAQGLSIFLSDILLVKL